MYLTSYTIIITMLIVFINRLMLKQPSSRLICDSELKKMMIHQLIYEDVYEIEMRKDIFDKVVKNIVPIMSFKIDVSTYGKRPLIGAYRKDYDLIGALRCFTQRYVIFFK